MAEASVIEGPAIQYLMLGMVARKLATEINTGLKSNRVVVGDQSLTPMDAARAICGTPKRTKRGVLCDYIAWWMPVFKEAFGKDWDMGESVKRAMVKPSNV